jgi:hypothetical protein
MQDNLGCKRSSHEIVFRPLENTVCLCCKMHPGAEMFTDDLEKIKTDLQNGIKNNSCNTCWKAEFSKNKSWRMHGNEHYEKRPNKYQIELYFDNTCDSACVYCSRIYSSKWEQEILNTSVEPPTWADREIKNKHTPKKYADYVFNYISEVAKNKKEDDYYEIILLGGEPLLMSINKKELLDLTIESFYKNTDPNTYLLLTIQTNANTPPKIMDKCLEKMSFYKQKYPNLNYLISISAESVGQNFEYIRYGCSYDRFVENFKKWANTGYLMSTNMAINPISITMLPDYFNFLIYITMKYKIKIDVKANIVYTPGITVGFLDDRFKKYVKRSIKIVNKFRNRFDNYEEIIENLQVVYNTIGSDITLRRIKQFSEAIEYFSKVRKLSLKDVNPLLQDYINEKLKYYEYYEE